MENKVTLYIATHNKTGLKYFGKTTRYFTEEDLQSKYHGSGKYWKRHLKKHGDDVTMKIYGIYDIAEVEDIALRFSEENNIVKLLNEEGKKVWANEKLENGLDGGFDKSKISCLDENNNIIWIDYSDYIEGNFIHFNTGRIKSEDEKIKISTRTSGKNNPMFGKTHSKESIEKISSTKKGSIPWNKGKKGVYSEETLKKLRKPKSEAHKEKLRGPKSEAHKQALRNNQYDKTGKNNPMFGKVQSEETRKKIAEKLKNQPKIKCPFCGKEGNKGNMRRWHFDNCKFR